MQYLVSTGTALSALLLLAHARAAPSAAKPNILFLLIGA